MHDQPTPVEQDDQIDGVILAVLCDEDAQRPWTVDEIGREIGDDVAAADSLSRLARGGLIHRLDVFVFATRAALRGTRLAL
jgi:hypothetical protein